MTRGCEIPLVLDAARRQEQERSLDGTLGLRLPSRKRLAFRFWQAEDRFISDRKAVNLEDSCSKQANSCA
jgi:hypothetical protein